ncbi:peptidylprolyl isomerase [Rhodobacter maris]|uniref:Parvulin-like PPIase n=1 Tax=Rhodobacter maris TaxID=446682 RepID=A0A285RYI2_9RHOB|nr:peptidylprolyl isomerase [Rhodobacter maris]SOB99660.1 periplasmic chaperone for outer membrane proteins SurA [Rhodobacter maris]
MTRHFSSLLAPRLAALIAISLVLALGLIGLPARAQSGSPFAPAITVNDMAITGYEIAQRQKFMQLLGATGDVRKMAEDALIEDRLRQWKARQDGVAVSDQAVNQGMAEFASRANLSAEEFVKALGENGVDAQTYRDFVSAGVIWREVVKANFVGRVMVSDSDIDRALRLVTPRAERAKVLLSEVVVRIGGGGEAEAMAKARRAAAARTEAEFAEVAREISSSPSATKGGHLDWMSIESLPAEVRGAVANLRPGHSTGPLPTSGAVAVFFMRGLDEGGAVAPSERALDYATLTLGATGSAESAALAAKVAARAQRCDDLYSVARGLPADRLTRMEGTPAGAVPADLGAVLPRLDPGETAVVRRGGTDVLVMLCNRGRAINADLGETGPSRDAARSEIINTRITTLSDQLLAALKASAVIVRK